MNRKYFVAYLLIIAVFSSCSTLRKHTVIKMRHISKKELFNFATVKNPSFDNISIKYAASFEKGNVENSFNGTIRILRDSAIWVTINAALGIEVARALFEKDSLRLINFHEKVYYFGNYHNTKNVIGSELDFNILQNILTSTLLLPDEYQPTNIDETIVENEVGEFEVNERFKDFTSNLRIDSQSYKIKEIKIVKALSPITITVSYDRYITIDDRIFPQSIIIRTKDSQSKSVLNLVYNKITLDKEIKIPFRVPNRFETVPLK